MNPSASGWISKLGHILKNREIDYSSNEALINAFLKHGFIYGIHLSVPSSIHLEHPLTEDEIAKTNLLLTLYFSYTFETENDNFDDFVNIVFDFYTILEVSKISFLSRILNGNKTESQLEKLLDSRIYLNGSAFNRAFGNSLANSLLYIDILIFKRYLQEHKHLIEHAQLLEYVAITIGYEALNAKTKDENDAKLIRLLDASLSYISLSDTALSKYDLSTLYAHFNTSEKNYLMDIACLTLWEDGQIERSETEFLYIIGRALGKTHFEAEAAFNNVVTFFNDNKDRIAYLKDSNLASKFYEGMTKNVHKLILRNSKRLKKELAESRELVALLSKSINHELSKEERRRIQGQLWDIFKSIPSLAIFMLPGGAVLLPIFIRLIPKLLPSAFDDNRVKD